MSYIKTLLLFLLELVLGLIGVVLIRLLLPGWLQVIVFVALVAFVVVMRTKYR